MIYLGFFREVVEIGSGWGHWGRDEVRRVEGVEGMGGGMGKVDDGIGVEDEEGVEEGVEDW